MDQQLIARRETAMNQLDAILDRNRPSCTGDEYFAGVGTVVEDLTSVYEAAKMSGGNRIELSKTARMLAAAYHDWAGKEGIGARMLRSKALYEEAERWLEDADVPLERAKLSFNYANTLRRIDLDDVGLLEEAQRRYQSAIHTFRNEAPRFVPQVEQAMASLELGLNSARFAKKLASNRDKVESATSNMSSAEEADRAMQLMSSSADEGIQGILRLLSSVPEQFQDDPRLAEAWALFGGAKEVRNEMHAAKDPQVAQIYSALKDRMAVEVREGRVGPAKMEAMKRRLGDFLSYLSGSGASVSDMMQNQSALRQAIDGFSGFMEDLSHGLPKPPEGSRAYDLVGLLRSVRSYLKGQHNLAFRGQSERDLGAELMRRASEVDRALYVAGSDDGAANSVSRTQLRPLLTDVHEFAHRQNLLLVKPIWARRPAAENANQVFYSGHEGIEQLVRHACDSVDLEVTRAATGADYGAARWQQLTSSSLAVFDFGDMPAKSRAAVAYELGIARAIGKASVILADPNSRLPFDVDIAPKDPNSHLSWTIESALTALPPLGEQNALAGLRSDLQKLYGQGGSAYQEQGFKQLSRLFAADPVDPVAVGKATKSFIGLVPSGRALVHSEWPAVPPSTPKVFHVMPFSERWSNWARDAVRDACPAGINYRRGDENEDPRIIRAIWEDITSATHIVVDMTGLNANVSLELGMAHALGKPTLLVTHGPVPESTFPAIQKERYQTYSDKDSLAESVRRFLKA